MSGKNNPGFVYDDGKGSTNSFSPVVNSTEQLTPKGNGKSYTVELNDLKEKEANETGGYYDPFQNRDVEHPTTFSETLLHLLKGSLGTGILAMPLAFYHSGYIVGLIATILIGSLCTYCIHLIINAEYVLCVRRKIPSMTYPSTAEAAMEDGPPIFQKLAPYAGLTTNIFLIMYQMGTGCVYTVFIAENVKQVCDQHFDHIDIKLYMLIFLLPLIFINYIRNLKFLAPLSTIANIITVASFGIIIYYLVKADMTFDGKEAMGKISQFPLFFGTVLFALEAIGVIMPLENEMKKPKKFRGPLGVLNIGMISIIVLYAGMGTLGYLAYGSDAKGSVTLNLTPNEIPAQVAKIMLAIAIYITHPLQMYVAIDIIWNQYLHNKFEKSSHQLLYEYVCRTALVLITFGLAVAIPKLDLFISLFGALCLSALGLAFPALIDMSTNWYELKSSRKVFVISRSVAIIFIGIVGLIIGTYTSLKEIIESFGESS